MKTVFKHTLPTTTRVAYMSEGFIIIFLEIGEIYLNKPFYITQIHTVYNISKNNVSYIGFQRDKSFLIFVVLEPKFLIT